MRRAIRPEAIPDDSPHAERAPKPASRKRQRTRRGLPIPPAPASGMTAQEYQRPEYQTNAINPPPFEWQAPGTGAKPESGVRLKPSLRQPGEPEARPKRRIVGYDPAVPWRNEAKKTLDALDSAEDDWEKRLLLIKLANFIAEAQYPLGHEQTEELNRQLNKIPAKGPIPEAVLKEVADQARDIWEAGSDKPE